MNSVSIPQNVNLHQAGEQIRLEVDGRSGLPCATPGSMRRRV